MGNSLTLDCRRKRFKTLVLSTQVQGRDPGRLIRELAILAAPVTLTALAILAVLVTLVAPAILEAPVILEALAILETRQLVEVELLQLLQSLLFMVAPDALLKLRLP